MAKPSNRAGESSDAADRITSFPDDMIDKISSLSLTKEEFETSLEWTKHWTMSPKLEFIPSCKLSDDDFDTLVEFVDKVFISKEAPVLESFSVDLGDERDCPRIETWAADALNRSAKEINITGISRMPECLFGSKTLVALKLSFVTLDVPPAPHLPCLKILHLSNVKYSNTDTYSLGRVIDGCPVLEDLMVKSKYNLKFNFTISAPTLKSLHFDFRGYDHGEEDVFNEIQLNAPSLKYLKVNDGVMVVRPIQNLDEVERAYICTPSHLISGTLNALRKAQEITLNTIFPEPCPKPEGFSCNLEGNFDSLVRLGMSVVPHHRTTLLKLLRLCPNLQDLDLGFVELFEDDLGFDESIEDDQVFDVRLRRELQDSLQPWCLNLKSFSIWDFFGNSYEFTLVAYILNGCSKLETVEIRALCDLELARELLTVPKLSPACEISISY